MAAEDLITQADIELAIGGPEYLIRFTDDDRDNTADAGVVAMLITRASQIAIGRLKNGFPSFEDVQNLVNDDEQVRGFVVDIACGLAGERRPDMVTADGKPILRWRREQGEKGLTAIGQAQARAAGEEGAAGTNRLLHARTSVDIADRAFYFPRQTRGSNSPNGGGGY